MPGVIVPRKTVTELHKLIEDLDGEIDMALSQAKVRFSFGLGRADLKADRRHFPRL